MTIELNSLVPWIALLLSALGIVLPFVSNRSKDIDKKIASKAGASEVSALALRVDRTEDRIVVVENDLKHLPDKEVTHRLELSISEMRAEVGRLTEKMKPLGAIADRIQDAVMEKVMSE